MNMKKKIVIGVCLIIVISVIILSVKKSTTTSTSDMVERLDDKYFTEINSNVDNITLNSYNSDKILYSSSGINFYIA